MIWHGLMKTIQQPKGMKGDSPAWLPWWSFMCEPGFGDSGDVDRLSLTSLWDLEVWSEISSPSWDSSSASRSSVDGSTNISSSESAGCRSLACRTVRTRLATFTVSLKSGHVDTQMRGSWPSIWRILQWSSKRNISPTWIFDGSFHSNLSGMHSGLIQDVGSCTSDPHGIGCAFPVRKPSQ